MNAPRPPARRPSVVAAALIATIAVALTLAAPQPAHAWGERNAYRDCGTNWIESWKTSAGGKANTIKLRGSCSGRLQVGLRGANGSFRWVQGSNSSASIELPGVWYGGIHRGCWECGNSTT